jgi:predicted alternative tryptophan synthase beta-subunit
VIREVENFKRAGKRASLAFCLSGTGYLDLAGYADAFDLDRAGRG